MPRLKGAPKTGGRKAGVPNKSTSAKVKAIEASGLTPLEYMLNVMRDSSDEDKRFEAAKAAAPYVHARLSAVDAKVGNPDGSPLDLSISLNFVKP